MLNRVFLLLSTLLLSAFQLTAAPKPFVFNGQSVPAGRKLATLLHITDGRDSTVVPVTVFHGRRPGPVLGIIAGVHGYEYPPIMAAQQLSKEIDPEQLRGTVLLVHVANVPSFLGRRIQVNPQDNKNLNRVFPGKPDGTITERLAYRLGNDVIGRCTHVIDVHAGDALDDLRPYAGYYNYFDTPELSEKGCHMASVLGFPYVIQFGNEPSLKDQASVYCSREAIKRGIPAIDIECGRFGLPEPEHIAQIKQALQRLLGHLQMTESQPAVSIPPALITQRTTVNSTHTGFFFPLVKAGEFIYKGRQLGYITDLFGNHSADVLAPVNGVVLYMMATPPISKGESLFSIGHLPKAAQP
ncbi:succinylglutamate desuccinylase/aspartoacylase family protein [Hymenobacter sp. DG01]|uniref:succinylglutamate desuccinylase/aspartoacylase family protein n=1 Tax=Hymenobacter sp. DG01 TaxID=2584940 RepID=UPI001121A4E8|nr:M14 family metallopeptidase [Hymenobacter sp. DG01]